jgi:hypothetical protein
MFLAKNRNPAGKAAAFHPNLDLNSSCHLFSRLFVYRSKCFRLGSILFNKSTHFVGGGYIYIYIYIYSCCWTSASVKLISKCMLLKCLLVLGCSSSLWKGKLLPLLRV